MKDQEVRKEMTRFVVEYGISQTPEWRERIRASLPNYHLELAVSTGSKRSRFTISTSQIERVSVRPYSLIYIFAHYNALDAAPANAR
jgi:hypothetical protein